MSLWLIFLTGLTTGGLSCLAMQGGLLAGMVTSSKSRWFSLASFLVVKLVSYTLLGFALGWLGSFFTLSLGVRLAFQILTSLFLFATAMNLMEIHPIFRYALLQPPKWLTKHVRASSKLEHLMGPAILGFFTLFIPCGVTQAMEVVAISSGKPFIGALTMFSFVLGTMPLFGVIGLVTAKLSGAWQQKFGYIAAILLLFMSFYGINGVLTVLDAPITGQKIAQAILSIGQPPSWYPSASSGQVVAPVVNGVQKQTISITSSGYEPRAFTVKAGVPVELTLQSSGAYTCASSFTFQKFRIAVQLQPTDTKVVRFTPTETGEFTYACSMGMYRGVMTVVR